LKDLARLTRMQPAGLSRQVQVLETAGYVVRWPDPTDGRVSVVRATPRGRFAYKRVWAAVDDLLAVHLEDWTGAALEEAATILGRLEHDFRANGRPQRRPDGAVGGE